MTEPLVETEHITLGETGSVAAVLWLNRPDSLNAMNLEMVRELSRAFAGADEDPRVASILVSGRGRAFSAGGDLKAYVRMQQDPAVWTAFLDEIGDAFARISFLSKPVVALVNGVTVAGGLELVLACDFAYAERGASIGDGHLRFAQIGGAGVLAHLPRLIGPGRARELLFSGRLLSADEALEWGLVNRVVGQGELLAAGLEFAQAVAEFSPAAVASMKYALNAGWADGTGVHSARRLERERAALYVLTRPDSMEGLRAFSEKRKPSYPGRRDDTA